MLSLLVPENDGTGAIRDIERIARGYPLRKVAEPLIIKGSLTERQVDAVQDYGNAMAAGLCLGIY